MAAATTTTKKRRRTEFSYSICIFCILSHKRRTTKKTIIETQPRERASERNKWQLWKQRNEKKICIQIMLAQKSIKFAFLIIFSALFPLYRVERVVRCLGVYWRPTANKQTYSCIYLMCVCVCRFSCSHHFFFCLLTAINIDLSQLNLRVLFT